MQYPLYKIEDLSNPIGEIDISDMVAAVSRNDDLIWQLVNSTNYQRITTKSTKSRSDKRGGGKKPWRQKGTGRARAGTSRSPIWVGGGITFSHESRVCKHKINKKMYRKGIASMLSEIIAKKDLIVVESLQMETNKTKSLRANIKDLLETRKILALTSAIDENFLLASRNFYEILYGEWRSLLAPDVLCNANKVLVTKQALNEIEEWLS